MSGIKFDEFDFWGLVFLGITLCAFCFFVGYNQGMFRGARYHQNCMDNGAIGWRIDGKDFTCIFSKDVK